MISTKNSEHSLPSRYADVKYDNIPKAIREKIKKSVRENKGFYLFGECGTGKTYIAYGVWQRFRELNIPAKLYKSTELLDLIRDFYGKNHYDYRDNELKMLLDYEGVLILDDIGAEKPTEWVAETFYKVIDSRYEKKLVTIFTSNFSLGEIAEKLTDRIASRIAEMCEIIKVEGVDKRI